MTTHSSMVGNSGPPRPARARLAYLPEPGSNHFILSRGSHQTYVVAPNEDHNFVEICADLGSADLELLAEGAFISRDAAFAYGMAGLAPRMRSVAYDQALATARSARLVDLVQAMEVIRRRLLVRRALRARTSAQEVS